VSRARYNAAVGTLGRTLLVLGLLLAAVGGLLLLFERGGWRLPGDFVITGRRFQLYLPLGTSLLLSFLASLLLWLLSRRS